MGLKFRGKNSQSTTKVTLTNHQKKAIEFKSDIVRSENDLENSYRNDKTVVLDVTLLKIISTFRKRVGHHSVLREKLIFEYILVVFIKIFLIL